MDDYFITLMACYSVLCRYLILLDKFLTELSPQEIEAVEMPTLEEVREALDARGTRGAAGAGYRKRPK